MHADLSAPARICYCADMNLSARKMPEGGGYRGLACLNDQIPAGGRFAASGQSVLRSMARHDRSSEVSL